MDLKYRDWNIYNKLTMHLDKKTALPESDTIKTHLAITLNFLRM